MNRNIAGEGAQAHIDRYRHLQDDAPRRIIHSIERHAKTLTAEDTARVSGALALSMYVHDERARDDWTPYLEHVLEVADTALDFKIKDDPNFADILCSALLHDTVEEEPEKLLLLAEQNGFAGAYPDDLTPIFEYLASAFGERVSTITRALTRDPYPPGITREEHDIIYKKHIGRSLWHDDPGVFYVKLADFLCNTSTIRGIEDGNRQGKLARKWSPVFEIFKTRLMEDDILIPRQEKSRLRRRLTTLKKDTRRIADRNPDPHYRRAS